MEKEYEIMARKFKALSDPNRIWILNILKQGEYCACNLLEMLNVTQPTLSHHMKILSDAEIVNARKNGKWVYYSLSTEGIKYLVDYLSDFENCSTDLYCCEE